MGGSVGLAPAGNEEDCPLKGGLEMPWLSWLSVLLGVWLIISPWVLGFTTNTNAFWNAILVGIAVVVVSAAHLMAPIAARPKI